MKRPTQSERGSSTVEFAIGTVVMVLFLLVVLQVAMYSHTRSVALTAARHGVDRGRVVDGDASTARSTAEDFLDQAGSALERRRVSADRTGERTSVRVEGLVVAVLPGLHLTIEVEQSAPTEGVTP